MPCRDYEGVPDTAVEDRLREEKREVKARLDLATRVACTLEKLLTPKQFASLPAESQKWITEHREADRKAREMEKRQAELKANLQREEDARKALRQAALKKLTANERRVLGL